MNKYIESMNMYVTTSKYINYFEIIACSQMFYFTNKFQTINNNKKKHKETLERFSMHLMFV
jgi:hypothetical protein